MDFQSVWLAEMVKTASSKPRGVTGEIQGLRLLSQLQDLPCTAGASELLRHFAPGPIGPSLSGPWRWLGKSWKTCNKYIVLKKKDGSITNKVWIYTVHM